MGQVTFGASFQAESAHEGIEKTIAISRVVYARYIPLVLLDKTWIPTKDHVTTFTIMPISEIDIYLGFAELTQPTLEVMTMAEEISGSNLSAEADEFKISKKTKPTQPAPVVEEAVE